MATKKAMAKKPSSQELQDLQRQIAEQASKINESVGSPVGNRIRITQAKRFRDADNNETPGPINLVVLDFNSFNAYYESDYDADNIESPTCFSLSLPASLHGNPNSMVPSDSSSEKQHTDCKTCPMNKFGTDRRGRGKACQNRRVLACVNPDLPAEDAPIQLLSVSPSAISRWDAFVRTLSSRQQIPVMGITEVSFDPNTDFPSLMFKANGSNPQLQEHFTRQGEARELLAQEPQPMVSDSEATQTKPRGKAPARGRRRNA